jgi:SAM-dependent methyltransferase
MGLIGGTIGYRLLRFLTARTVGNNEYTAYQGRSKVEVLFGPQVWKELAGKVVMDFGCESGYEAIDVALHGAKKVIGLDIYEPSIAGARRNAEAAGVADRCVFSTETSEKVDVIMTLDAFEHFQDPSAVLVEMAGLLKPGGYVLACFGPTWYHPLGGHGFSIFPWAHLVFTENAFMRWHRDSCKDGATKFSDVRGGLNQLTIRGFEEIVAKSPFRVESFEAVPIRKLRPFANRLTREFTTAVVKCKLYLKNNPHQDSEA